MRPAPDDSAAPAVIVYGTVCLDQILLLDSDGKPHGTLQDIPGGEAFNTATALTGWGVPTLLTGTALGSSPESNRLRQLLDAPLVGVSRRRIPDLPSAVTPVCTIHVSPNGERVMCGAGYSHATAPPPLPPSDFALRPVFTACPNLGAPARCRGDASGRVSGMPCRGDGFSAVPGSRSRLVPTSNIARGPGAFPAFGRSFGVTGVGGRNAGRAGRGACYHHRRGTGRCHRRTASGRQYCPVRLSRPSRGTCHRHDRGGRYVPCRALLGLAAGTTTLAFISPGALCQRGGGTALPDTRKRLTPATGRGSASRRSVERYPIDSFIRRRAMCSAPSLSSGASSPATTASVSASLILPSRGPAFRFSRAMIS